MAISVSLIEDTVLDLLPAFLYEAFPLNGFINTVTDKLNVPEGDDKRRVQKETELILANDERLFYTTELCYPREVFFRKTQFRIIPGRMLFSISFLPGMIRNCVLRKKTSRG